MPKKAKLATKFMLPIDAARATETFEFGANSNQVDIGINGGAGSPDWYHIGSDYDYFSGTQSEQYVFAIANGEVHEVGLDDGGSSGYGNYVIIKHTLPNQDVAYSFYAHMEEPPLVDVGDFVNIGDTLGLVGETGFVIGEHLHFEMRFDDPNFTQGGIYSGSYDTLSQFTQGVASGILFDPDEFVLNYSSTSAVMRDFAPEGAADAPAAVPIIQGPQQFAVNSGFETGDLSGWEVLGSAAAVTSFDADGENGPTGDGLTTATEGDYFAVLESGGNASVSDIEAFLGLDSGALETISNGVPTTGTAMKIEVDVIRSTTFDFDFYFDAADYDPFNDFAFMVVDGELVVFGDVSEVGDYGDSDWLDSSWFEAGTTDLSRGTHEIGFGILDVGDEILSSALYVDDFQFI